MNRTRQSTTAVNRYLVRGILLRAVAMVILLLILLYGLLSFYYPNGDGGAPVYCGVALLAQAMWGGADARQRGWRDAAYLWFGAASLLGVLAAVPSLWGFLKVAPFLVVPAAVGIAVGELTRPRPRPVPTASSGTDRD
ncbi:MAG: hypothetical protein ACRCXL_00680 [Dermatophilaceae bacterium]